MNARLFFCKSAHQLFGDQLPKLLDELNTVLSA